MIFFSAGKAAGVGPAVHHLFQWQLFSLLLTPTVQYSSSYNVPSHHNCNPLFFLFLFFSSLLLFFLKPLTFLYSPLLSFFSPWIDPSSTVSASWCVLCFDKPPPSNPDSSALFLLLWWMLVCFSFAGRIVALWEEGECFSPATGVLGWGVYICSCLNNVRGEFI